MWSMSIFPEKNELFVTMSSNILNQRPWSSDYQNTEFLALRRHWPPRWRHKERQNHIFGYNFGSNGRRHFKLSSLDNITQGPSYVTLTLTFDLDLENLGQGQSFRKTIELFATILSSILNQRSWSADSRGIFLWPFDVTGRHNDVISEVKIT